MKAVGIIRRVDELGRIVLPKELRRTMHIRPSDPLEFFAEQNETIVLKKASLVDFSNVAVNMSKTLYKKLKQPILVCDTNKVLDVVGNRIIAKELRGRFISESLYEHNIKILNGRKCINMFCPVNSKNEYVTFLSAPIITDTRNILGSLSILGNGFDKDAAENIVRFQMTIDLIGGQLSES